MCSYMIKVPIYVGNEITPLDRMYVRVVASSVVLPSTSGALYQIFLVPEEEEEPERKRRERLEDDSEEE